MKIFIVTGEKSGDDLGAGLIRALRKRLGPAAEFCGVGGGAMQAQGFQSLFPLSDIAVMGFTPVIRRLPLLIRRIREAADAALAFSPDVVVLVDSPDFTHRVARRLRRAAPDVPVVDYVSPTVWAWRPGRARAMRAYVDLVLALLPFEPEAHARLGGPRCVYVGHPLIERLDQLRPNAAEAARRDAPPPIGLILPGSRKLEIARLLADFGAVAQRVSAIVGAVEWVLPAVDHLAEEIARATSTWTVKVRIAQGEEAKLEAFRTARVALAASGTVTLELALSQVPMVVAYKVSRVEEAVKYFVTAPSIVLPNLILGRRAVPELLQRECTPGALADSLVGLLPDGPERAEQLAAFETLSQLMLEPGEAPSDLAARLVLECAERKGRL